MTDRLIDAYERTTPRSRELYERATAVMPGGDTRSVTYYGPYPSFIDRAAGCRLVTEDEEELIDFLNNYTQSVLGHAPQPVVDAVSERFARGNGVGAPTEETVELAERLVDRISSVEQLRFGNSGTEATMNAIRAAMAHTGRDEVLKIQGGYHGTHDTVEVSVHGDGREHDGIPAAVEQRVHVTPFNDVETLKERFAVHGDDLACFILEPMLGVGGAVPGTETFLRTARDLADTHDVPLIFDEVMTFRLAYGGAQERYGVTPDLTTLGKLIGGGLPVGAFGGREDLMSVFHPEEGSVPHSGTFNGNPATMAGGLATLDLFDGSAIDRLDDLGDQLRRDLRAVADSHDHPVTITGDGSMFHVHFVDGPVTGAEAATDHVHRAEDLFLAMRNRGVFLAPRGMGNLSVPMTEAELEMFVDVFERSLSEIDPD